MRRVDTSACSKLSLMPYELQVELLESHGLRRKVNNRQGSRCKNWERQTTGTQIREFRELDDMPVRGLTSNVAAESKTSQTVQRANAHERSWTQKNPHDAQDEQRILRSVEANISFMRRGQKSSSHHQQHQKRPISSTETLPKRGHRKTRDLAR